MQAKSKEVLSPLIWIGSMPGMLESDLENVVWARQGIPFLQKTVAGPKGKESASNRLM